MEAMGVLSCAWMLANSVDFDQSSRRSGRNHGPTCEMRFTSKP